MVVVGPDAGPGPSYFLICAPPAAGWLIGSGVSSASRAPLCLGLSGSRTEVMILPSCPLSQTCCQTCDPHWAFGAER